MTEEGQGEPNRGPWGRVQFFVDHPLVLLVVRVTVPLLAFCVAATTFYMTQIRHDPKADIASPSTVEAQHSTSAGSSGTPTPPSPSAVTLGTCLDVEGTATACDGPHATEVFDVANDCNMDALLRYLGGIPGQDVLVSTISPTTASIGGRDICLVSGPSGTLASRSRDVLLNATGDAWRRCVDQAQREVGCSLPHKKEVVLERAPSGEDLDCARRADAYLESPFAQHSRDLDLEVTDGSCVISIRGRNVLTASLRRLGAHALPMRAAG
jgi:hypothetical protein